MTAPAELKWLLQTTTQEVAYSLPNADTPIVPYNKQRIALVLYPPPTGTTFFTWSGAAGGSLGWRLPTGNNAIVLSAAQHGSMVTGPIRGINSLGPLTCAYLETLAPLD